MVDTSRSAQIAHVLFLDLVGYSKESISLQGRLLEQLNSAVNGAEAFQKSREQNDVLPIPTGDGMALLFFTDILAPAQCALQIQKALAGMPVRMGIHSGLVQKQLDITGKENVVGEGINTASRVMGFGDAGHILLSAQYALFLGQFDEWKPRLHLLGDGTAKHNLQIQLFSLHGNGFGSPALPSGLKESKSRPVSRPSSGIPSQKVVLLYKRNLPEDEKVLTLLEKHLVENGHEVFVDQHLKIGVEWARAVEDKIRAADAVIAIVSPKAMQSEMLEYEVETAHDQYLKSGKPTLLPV
uniref:TIR domain-containing protein n=1 Tax=Armatimonas sp. TaxID=1872638 RepID=UPI003750B698